MEQRALGTSGLTVSSLALGTMTFGVETDEAGAGAQLDRFVEAGGTLIDTADVTLSDEEMDDLSVVSAPGIADYPYRMLARQCGMSVWDELRTRPTPD